MQWVLFMLHLNCQLSNTQQSLSLFLLTVFTWLYKCRLSCFFFFVYVSDNFSLLLRVTYFYPLFWTFFLVLSTLKTPHASFRSLLLSSRLLYVVLTVHWLSTCLSLLCLRLLFTFHTCLSLYVPLFCKWYYHPLSGSSQKIISVLFILLQYLLSNFFLHHYYFYPKSNHHWSGSLQELFLCLSLPHYN